MKNSNKVNRNLNSYSVNEYNVKMTSTLNPTLLITHLLKRIVLIVPRKLKNTLKETKQIIRQITLNPGM